MTIQILPEIVAAQIAAGEVVERPASVVKELVENSIDAAASDIRIEIAEGGRALIRVNDNGHGINSAEVETAFVRHATSKLTTIEDLNTINTLGFRGEALHSIAAVSRLTLTTRHSQEKSGSQVQIVGGKFTDQRKIGVPPGTIITVEELFFNTPARLKFLKNVTTERRHITTMVTNYALAYPNIKFTLYHDKREVLRTYGTGNLFDVLAKALGADTQRHMIEVTPQPPKRPDLPPIQVHGYVSTPDQSRSNRSHITLFVNGRAIKDTSLAYAVTQAYHTLLPKGRYPIAVLMIDLPPEEVDVNVHPTKAEVRFRSADAIFSAVQRAVRSAVVAQAPPPAIQYSAQQNTGHNSPAPGWQQRRESLLPPVREAAARPAHPVSQQQKLNLELERPGDFGQQLPPAAPTAPLAPADDFESIPDGPQPPARPRTLPMLRVLGQVGAAYIVAEGPIGMYLVDQHAAHERILFEEFMAQQVQQKTLSQKILIDATLEVSLATIALIEENMTVLTKIGFELEPFGGQTLRIRAVPAILAGGDPAEAMHIIVEDLENNAQPGQATLEEQIILRVCKAAAVKAGQVLSLTEMQSLIQQLERCESPHTCPHGRPTLIYISGDQLAREFGRT
ncbi:DNA mismatch repair endonuclease MutL [Chloroflexota bacterium]